MTSQDPVRFENYPPTGGSPAPSFQDPPGAAPEFEITPYHPTDVPPPPPAEGINRRGVVALFVAVPIGGLILATITRGFESPRDGNDDPWPSSWATSAGDPGSESIVVGQYSASLPDGWTVADGSGDVTVVKNGANRLLADTFMVDPGRDRATDLIGAITKRRVGSFKGTLPEARDLSVSGSDVQHALLSSSGKVGKKAATLRAQLWIDAYGSALLVLETLVATPGTAIAEESAAIVDELSRPFS